MRVSYERMLAGWTTKITNIHRIYRPKLNGLRHTGTPLFPMAGQRPVKGYGSKHMLYFLIPQERFPVNRLDFLFPFLYRLFGELLVITNLLDLLGHSDFVAIPLDGAIDILSWVYLDYQHRNG